MMRARFGRIISITSVVGTYRQSGPGQLCRVQGGLVGMSKAMAPGSRLARHHRQLHRARLHSLGDDRRAARLAEGRRCSAASRPAISAR
jgi:hypothetical protein